VPYFSLKNWAFDTPSPLEFTLTFLGVGMNIFWNYTLLWEHSAAACIAGLAQSDCLSSINLLGLEYGTQYHTKAGLGLLVLILTLT